MAVSNHSTKRNGKLRKFATIIQSVADKLWMRNASIEEYSTTTDDQDKLWMWLARGELLYKYGGGSHLLW